MQRTYGIATTPDGSAGWSPPSKLPSPEAARYWQNIITLLLLVVALPWLLYNLLTRPSTVLVGRGPTGVA